MSALRSSEGLRLVKHLARLVQATHLYPGGSEHQRRSAGILHDALRLYAKPFRLTLMGREMVVGEETVEEPSQVEKLLVKLLRNARWESLRIDSDIAFDDLLELALRLVAAEHPPVKGKGYLAGLLTLESANAPVSSIASAAVGYLKLLAGARQSMEELGRGKMTGLDDARQVVAGITAHLATGRNIFQPIRNLKSYDEYTFTHALNVALISTALAKALGVPSHRLDDLSLSALCHDVGKERIPKEILHKETPLTERERAIVERHPADGAHILLHLPGKLPAIVPVVAYQHHIYPNGAGYPTRLPRQRIHPANLIVSLADTYDALRTVRPYSSPATSEGAMNVILAQAKKRRFDRTCVAALAGLLGVAAPGRRVKLTDGREAEVARENPDDALQPLVAFADGSTADLSRPEAPAIDSVPEPAS